MQDEQKSKKRIRVDRRLEPWHLALNRAIESAEREGYPCPEGLDSALEIAPKFDSIYETLFPFTYLVSHGDKDTWHWAVRVMGRLAHSDGNAKMQLLEELQRTLRSDKHTDIRETALMMMTRIGQVPLDSIHEIIRIVTDPGSTAALRRQAILMLPSSGPDAASEAVPALIEALVDPEANVRLAACRTLGELGGQAIEAEDAIPALVDKLDTKENLDIQNEAVRALLRIDPKGKRLSHEIKDESQRQILLTTLRTFGFDDKRARQLRTSLYPRWRTQRQFVPRSGGEIAPVSETDTEVNHAADATRPLSRDGGTVIDNEENCHIKNHDLMDQSVLITENSEYWLFTKRLTDGTKVVFKDGRSLPLKGQRWKKVLELLAKSADGQTASKRDLAHGAGMVATASGAGFARRSRLGARSPRGDFTMDFP